MVFDSIRKSLNDLLARNTRPEERGEIVARMRDTLVRAKMGLDDLRAGISASRQRLDAEQRELATVQRRKRLAEQINDAETVRLADQYEVLHAEKVAVLTRKLEAQEGELAIAEREVAEMMVELKQSAKGIPGAAESSARAARDAEADLEAELGETSGAPLRDEIDSLARSRVREQRDADAARKLDELKRRMGK